MIFRTHPGLTTKFNILTILLILSTSIGVGTFATLRGRANNYERLLRKGMTTAAMVAQNSEYGVYAEDRSSLQQIVRSLDADDDIAFVAVLNRDMRVLVDNRMKPGIRIPSHSGPLPTAVEHLDFRSLRDGKSYILVLMPVMSRAIPNPDALYPELGGDTGNEELIGYVRLGLSQQRIDAEARQFLLSTTIVTSVLVLLGTALTVLMTRRIASPIKELAHVTHDISEGHFERDVNISAEGEIGDLATAFNLMLGRLRLYRSEVESYRESLETQVEERTIELQEGDGESLCVGRAGRSGEPGEESVPRKHESRDSHSDERSPRHD